MVISELLRRVGAPLPIPIVGAGLWFLMAISGCAAGGGPAAGVPSPGIGSVDASAGRAEADPDVRFEPPARPPGTPPTAPVTRLEIEVPMERPFVGTSIRLRALASRGDLEASTPVEAVWTSRNPEIASVTTRGTLRAHRPGRAALQAEVEGRTALLVVEVVPNPVVRVDILPASGAVRIGDVLRFRMVARDAEGEEVGRAPVLWSVGGGAPVGGGGATVDDDGRFVAVQAGEYRVVATVGSVAGEATVEVRPQDEEARVLTSGSRPRPARGTPER
jgi:hypothetical protein